MKTSHVAQGNDWESTPMRGVAVAVVTSACLFWGPLAVVLFR